MGDTRKDPAFLFYATTWLQSLDVRSMSPAQRGVYIDLLSFSWLHDGLPDDQDRLAAIVGVGKRDFRRIWLPPLSTCWQQDDAGRLRNPRQEHERAERRRHAERMRELSRQGNGARWPKDGTGVPSTSRTGPRRDNVRDANGKPCGMLSISNSTSTPTPPSSGGANSEPEGGEPEPAGEGSSDPVVLVQDAILATCYRSELPKATRLRAAFKVAKDVAAVGLGPDAVAELDELDAANGKGERGALLATWFDRGTFREVLDEQRMKTKEHQLQSRANATENVR